MSRPSLTSKSSSEQIQKTLQDTKRLLGNIKNRLEGMGVNVTKYEKMMIVAKRDFMVFLKKYWIIILTVGVSVFGFLFYMSYVYGRVPRCLAKLQPLFKDLRISPLTSCQEMFQNTETGQGYVLADFYVASSYHSYIPCTQQYDYSSLDMIATALQLGARSIELDIYNKTFCQVSEPVVCNGKEVGNWHWTTVLSFDKCCETISNIAFGSGLPNATDPLFLVLNLYIGKNEDTAKQIAESIQHHFSAYLLSPEFASQQTNIGTRSIQEFINKVIIVSNMKWTTNSLLNQLINSVYGSQAFMMNYSNIQIQDAHDPEEIQKYTSTGNMARVYPATIARQPSNYSPFLAWTLGCNLVSMFYNVNDTNLQAYLRKFSRSSFVLKPETLLYEQQYIPKPTPQTSKVSPQPRMYQLPGFDFAM